MRGLVLHSMLLLIVAAVATAAWSKDTHTPAVQFKPGQVWSYKTRPQDKGSTFTVILVEQARGHELVHVRVDGLHLKNPMHAGGFSDSAGHLPMEEEALRACRDQLLREGAVVPQESLGGYKQWKQAFDEGHAGAFNIPLADVIDTLERTLNHQEANGRVMVSPK